MIKNVNTPPPCKVIRNFFMGLFSEVSVSDMGKYDTRGGAL